MLLWLNIAWVLYASFDLDIFINNNWKRFIPVPFLIYTLLIFNFKNFETKNGLLINPDTNWIYLQTFSLILWYIYTCNPCSVFTLLCLVVYPLFFPLKEYFLHRGFSLYLVTVFAHYFNLTTH